ncbi:MAG: type II toxin-antitoxin system HicA family toxin [Cytophagales bacterium]|nr:MAG: type II toxin-antitoxin system HicA family toxin [Cytophagales bacterium]
MYFNLKVKEIIKRLENDGWVLRSQKGSHMVFKKAGVTDLITLPNHGMNAEPSIGVVKSIFKIAKWA